MTRTFTTEEFTGYTFVCDTTSANVGFKHICKVYKDNEEDKGEIVKAVINWGNRTWESYPYQSVYEQAKSLLADKLKGTKEEQTELDYDFLSELANSGYIYDYAEDESGDTYIMADGWSQIKEGSVWHKLVELAKANRLKPSVNQTMLTLEDNYVFTDEYTRCSECGKLLNLCYAEGTLIENNWYCGYYCNDCINSNQELIQILVDKALNDYEYGIPAEVDSEILEGMGYSPVAEGKDFSFMSDNWTADLHISREDMNKICEEYNGFIKIAHVQQFDVLFNIFVPTDKVEKANKELKLKN